MFWGRPTNLTEKPSGKSQPGVAVYLVKVLDENLHHDVLELNIHHCCNRVLLCTHEGGAKDHPHVGGGHEILPAMLTHTVRRRRKNRGGVQQREGHKRQRAGRWGTPWALKEDLGTDPYKGKRMQSQD